MDGTTSLASTYFSYKGCRGVYLARVCAGRVFRVGFLIGINPEAYRPGGVNTGASEPKHFIRGVIKDIFRMAVDETSGMTRVTISQAVIIGTYISLSLLQ